MNGQPKVALNALNDTNDINSMIGLINAAGDYGGAKALRPDLFYNKQLLDTIRLDAKEYVYYRLAETQAIGSIAGSNQLRRWAPLQGHTIPLAEGVPPKSDKGSVETYTMTTAQYGRYMEFTDKVDFSMIDPIVAFYTKEYSLVAMETLDLLAREALEEIANPYYAGMAAGMEDLTLANAKPNLEDLRKIVLSFDRQLVKPRSNGRFHVIAGPEFYYDMIDDPTVVKYMTINQDTKTMYDNSQLVPLFRMEFYQTLAAPASGKFIKMVSKTPKKALRLYTNGVESAEYITITEDSTITAGGQTIKLFDGSKGGYVLDSRTGQSASYIPLFDDWKLIELNEATKPGSSTPLTACSKIYTKGEEAAVYSNLNNKVWNEFKVASVYIIGKDALTRTGLSGQDSAKMYVKPLGSAGTLDPINQRQSIGFKINDVGFGSTRTEAVVRYLCVPTQLNVL